MGGSALGWAERCLLSRVGRAGRGAGTGGGFQRRFFSGVVEGVGSVLWGEQGRVNSLGWGREVDMGYLQREKKR